MHSLTCPLTCPLTRAPAHPHACSRTLTRTHARTCTLARTHARTSARTFARARRARSHVFVTDTCTRARTHAHARTRTHVAHARMHCKLQIGVRRVRGAHPTIGVRHPLPPARLSAYPPTCSCMRMCNHTRGHVAQRGGMEVLKGWLASVGYLLIPCSIRA